MYKNNGDAFFCLSLPKKASHPLSGYYAQINLIKNWFNTHKFIHLLSIANEQRQRKTKIPFVQLYVKILFKYPVKVIQWGEVGIQRKCAHFLTK